MEILIKMKKIFNKADKWACSTKEGRAIRRAFRAGLYTVIASLIVAAQNDTRYIYVVPFLMGVEKYLRDKTNGKVCKTEKEI